MSGQDRNDDPRDTKETGGPDETTAVMVYGNLKIIDVQTGDVLVNKRA